MKKTSLRRWGRRRDRDRWATRVFRLVLRCRSRVASDWRCERCRELFDHPPDPHHICGQGRAAGHPDLHDPARNGAALCRRCHRLVEAHGCDDWRDWIKPIAWLDQGGSLA